MRRTAALQYGIYRNNELPEKEEEGINVMFVDLGQSDMTATIVRLAARRRLLSRHHAVAATATRHPPPPQVKFSKGKLRVLSAESAPMFGSRDLEYAGERQRRWWAATRVERRRHAAVKFSLITLPPTARRATRHAARA